jgi:Zn-finger nucleic acid-binding protein
VSVPDISLTTTHEPDVSNDSSNDSSSDYDIESGQEQSIEVTLDANGRDTVLGSGRCDEMIEDNSVFEISNFERDMYASDRSEQEDQMHHKKKWFQFTTKKSRLPKV